MFGACGLLTRHGQPPQAGKGSNKMSGDILSKCSHRSRTARAERRVQPVKRSLRICKTLSILATRLVRRKPLVGVDGWISAPSTYAVAARNADDVVTAVNFAREKQSATCRQRRWPQLSGHLQRGGLSSYLDAAMNNIVLHEAFVAQGCEGKSGSAARRHH